MQNKRSLTLKLIVIYKLFEAFILTIASIFLFFSLANYQYILSISQFYILEGKLEIIEWLVKKIVNIKRQTLQFSAIVAGIYAFVTAIEAIGLWYEKSWAEFLVLALVGISIPPEIFELIKKFSFLKLIVFFINLAVLWYLWNHIRKHRKQNIH